MTQWSVQRDFFVMVSFALAIASIAEAEDRAPLYVPSHAFGLSSEPPPPAASLAGPNEFENRFRDGSLVLSVPSQFAADSDRSDAELRRSRDRMTMLIAPHRPDLIPRLLHVRHEGDSPILVTSSRGERLQRVLSGRNAMIREAVAAQEVFASLSNQRALFDHLRLLFPPTDAVQTIDPNQLGEGELRTFNLSLLDRAGRELGEDGGLKGPSGQNDCAAEEGSGEIGAATTGDQTGRICEFSPHSLHSLADWTLKPFQTCVRNQGIRATSAAFALTAAVETRLARQERRFANLSEQHLHNTMTMTLFRTPADRDDGDTPVLSSGRDRVTGYRFHFEDIWSYNPSYGRVEEPPGSSAPYAASCDRYSGRHCSESNHQGRLLCTTVEPYRFCGYDAPMPAATPTMASGLVVIFDILRPELSIHSARHLLKVGVPVILNTAVPRSMLETGNDGFVPLGSPGERLEGAQALELVGWVPNDRIPPGLPVATGDGYFVAKNSWGSCVGDAGYFYLASDWVQKNALNLTAVF